MSRKNPFARSGKRKRRRKSSEFSLEKANSLSLSDKGSYFDQEKLLEEPSRSASSKKLGKQRLRDDETTQTKSQEHERHVVIQDGGTCNLQKQSQLTIVDPAFIEEGLTTAAVCKQCGGNLELLENVNYRKGLGTVWVFRCLESSCSRNEHPTQFHTSQKTSQIYDLNRTSVVGMRAIGRGASAAKKLFSIMNIEKPVGQKPWSSHTETLDDSVENVLDIELKKAAWESKTAQRQLKKNNLERLDDEKLREKVVDIGVSLDCSWSREDGLQQMGSWRLLMSTQGK